MAARYDILDRREPMRNAVFGSIALHVAVFASAFLYGALPMSNIMQWGDPNSLGGGAVTITPVSKIPIPPRSGRVNPVANDTESRVPAPPKPQPAQKPGPADDPEADSIPSRAAKPAPAKPAPAVRRRSRPSSQATVDQPNQLYAEGGAAASSPMFGSTSGGGGVGVGTGNPFGSRFGYYVQLLKERVAAAWNTQQVDPRLQTAPTVIVTFDIQRDGSARNVRFLQRSGNSALDFSCQRAILDASPFPPLPREFERNTARIEFWFELKR